MKKANKKSVKKIKKGRVRVQAKSKGAKKGVSSKKTDRKIKIITKITKKIHSENAKMGVTVGGVIETPGSSLQNKTGGWRAFKPVWDQKKCIQCMICWQFCPDDAIPQEEGKRIKTNLDFCKGCGLCANVCPVKCIQMVKEEK